MNDFKIRIAKPSDAEDLLNIYKPYVLNTAITFEYEIPTISQFQDRIARTLEKYPYIIAIDNNQIVGYAYACAYKDRQAYNWAVETSIYIKNNLKSKGYGKRLYFALEEILKKQNVTNLYACITYAEKENQYISNDSMKFHQKLGYKTIGTFHKCGYKFNMWHDMIWMEKFIGEHNAQVKPFVKFSEFNLNY